MGNIGPQAGRYDVLAASDLRVGLTLPDPAGPIPTPEPAPDPVGPAPGPEPVPTPPSAGR